VFSDNTSAIVSWPPLDESDAPERHEVQQPVAL
jgi:hypothetical protein